MNDSHIVALAQAAVDASSITAVAALLDYSRPALSRYLSGSYGADPSHLEAAILARYDIHTCTHNGIEIIGADCQRRASAPRPFGGRAKEAHWLACQECTHNKHPQGVCRAVPVARATTATLSGDKS